MSDLAAIDRYDALRVPRPDRQWVCRGQCEGTGVVPVFLSRGVKYATADLVVPQDEDDPALIEAWEKAESEHPTTDGWHFVECPTCGGSGERK